MTNPCTFRRVILGLRNAPHHGLHQAAEIAALLGAELRGLFIQEADLSGLAAFPFAREFRPLEGGWRTLDREELALALDIAARSAQRSFSDAVKGLNLSCRFEIVHGSIADTIASVSRVGDIVVVPEPSSPTEKITLQFQSLVDAALGSAAAVMFTPSRVARQTGPIVAIAGMPQDPCIEVASAIAALANARLSIIDGAGMAAGFAAAAQVQEPLPAPLVSPDRRLSAIAAALEPLEERMFVLTRGGFFSSLGAMIASIRHVPVLIVEPHSSEGGGTQTGRSVTPAFPR